MCTVRLKIGEVLVFRAQGGLGGDSTKGQHSEAAIVNLLSLHGHLFFSTLARDEFEGVKAKVTGLTVVLALGNFDDNSSRAELNETDNQKKESHGSLLNEDVVSVVGVGDVFNRVDVSGEPEAKVGGDPSGPSKHGNAAVLDFRFPHPVDGRDALRFFPRGRLNETREILGNGGQVEGVKSLISWQRSVEVDCAGQERNRLGAFRLVDHRIPQALRHFVQGGLGPLRGGRRRKGRGRTGQHGSNGKRNRLHLGRLK